MTLSAEIDTESLPTPQDKELVAMIKNCRFFDLPPEIRTISGGADRFEYEITVMEENGKNQSLRVNEAAVPSSLQPLLDVLARIARSTRLSKG